MVLMALLVVTSSVVTLILIHNHPLVASLVSMVLKLMVSNLLMTLNLAVPLNLVVPSNLAVPFVMVVASVAVAPLILSSSIPLVQTD